MVTARAMLTDVTYMTVDDVIRTIIGLGPLGRSRQVWHRKCTLIVHLDDLLGVWWREKQYVVICRLDQLPNCLMQWQMPCSGYWSRMRYGTVWTTPLRLGVPTSSRDSTASVPTTGWPYRIQKKEGPGAAVVFLGIEFDTKASSYLCNVCFLQNFSIPFQTPYVTIFCDQLDQEKVIVTQRQPLTAAENTQNKQ